MSCLSRNSSYDHARGDIINGGGGEGGRIPFGLHTVHGDAADATQPARRAQHLQSQRYGLLSGQAGNGTLLFFLSDWVGAW